MLALDPVPASPVEGLDPNQIGPGFAGFLAIFGIALAAWLLFRSMNRHLRNVRYAPDPAGREDDAVADGPAGGGPAEDGPVEGGPADGVSEDPGADGVPTRGTGPEDGPSRP